MKVPEHAKTLDLGNSIIWIDDEGIMRSTPVDGPVVDPTREEITANMKRLRAFLGGRKVCMVVESNPNSRPPAKDMRDFVAEQLSSIAKAMAIVTSSPLSRMIANLFFSFKPPSYPMKMFTSEEEAVAWVRQYNKM